MNISLIEWRRVRYSQRASQNIFIVSGERSMIGRFDDYYTLPTTKEGPMGGQTNADSIERIKAALPDALKNIVQRNYPLAISPAGIGRVIPWKGDRRRSWPLMTFNPRNATRAVHDVYLISDGTLLSSHRGLPPYREVSLEDAASPAVADSLEQIAAFGGGPRRRVRRQRR